MEIKEAISRIENILDPFPFDPPFSPETCEALDMAIDALRILGDEDTISRKKIKKASAQPEQRWIPCSERLPEDRVSVIVCFREWQQYAKRYVYSIVVGWYARKHNVRVNVFSDWEDDWEDNCEYDEIEDEYYIKEGWYEFTTQGNGDLMNWYINADVIAWMELPEPYKENERGESSWKKY